MPAVAGLHVWSLVAFEEIAARGSGNGWRVRQMRIGGHATGGLARAAAAILLCLQLAACESYNGPVSNARPPAGSEGPPLLTGGYAP